MGNNSNRANAYRESLSQGSSSISSNNSNKGRASAYRESIGARTSGIDYRKSQADKLNRERIENTYTVPTKTNGTYYDLKSMTDDEVKAEYNSLNPGNFFERKAKQFSDMTYNYNPNESFMSNYARNLKTVFSLDDNEDYNRKQELSGRYREITNAETKQKMIDAGMTDELFRAMNQPNNPLQMEAQSKFEEIVNSGVVNSTDAMNMMLDTYTREATIENTQNDHVGANISAVLANPFESAINVGMTTYDYLAGNPISGYENYADVVREQTRNDIGSEAGKFWYDQGMSIADEGYAMLIGKLANNGNVGSAIQGIEKGASTINEGVERGLNPSRIVTGGISSAITTAITESISHGKLDKLAEVGKHGFDGKTAKEISGLVAKTLVGSSSTEALQEVEEELADYLSDVLINGDQNKFKEDYNSYIARGLTPSDAISMIIGDRLKELGGDALGGALGGIMFGGAGTVFNYATGNTQEAYEDKAVADRLKSTNNLEQIENTVKGMDKDSNAYKLYEKAIKDTENGKLEEATNADIKAVYDAVKADTAKGVYESEKVDELTAIKENLSARGIKDEKAAEVVKAYIDGGSKAVKGADQKYLAMDAVQDVILDIKNNGINLKENPSEQTKSLKDTQESIKNAFSFTNNLEKVSVDHGKLVIEKTNGEKVTIADGAMTENAEKLFREASKYNPLMQKAMIDNYKDGNIENYASAFNLAYEAGTRGNDDLLNSVVGEILGIKTFTEAFKLGQKSISEEARLSEEKLNEALKEWNGQLKSGNFKSNLNYKALNSNKKVLYNFAKGLSKMGVNITVIDDPSADTENGWFKASENGVMINLSARYTKSYDRNGARYVVNTMAHELTHYMEANAKSAYRVLESSIMDYFKGVSKDGVTEWDRQLQKYLDKGLSETEAKSEVIARACEDMLNDPKQMTDILSTIDGSKIGEVKKAVTKFFDSIRSFIKKLMNGYQSQAEEARILREIDGAFEDIQKKWAEAFAQAIAKQQKMEAVEQDLGMEYDSESGTVVNNSVRMTLSEVYKEHGFESYEQAIDEVAKDINAKAGIGDLEKVKNWIKSEESLAAFILDESNAKYLDYKPDDRYKAIKKNADYKQGTVDLSNLCRKREIFTKMFDALQKEYPGRLFTADDIAKIRQILVDSHYEVACALCYVEDRRQKTGEIADLFIDFWKDAVNSDSKLVYKLNGSGNKVGLYPTRDQIRNYGLKAAQYKATDSYIPTQYDLVTYEGLKALKENHPTIAYAFERYNSSRGMASARLIEGHAEYQREILDYTPAWIDKINNMGGLRVFSFSDFEAIHLIDICQVITDCAKMGVKIQTYTKVPEFAALVRNTGIKLNRSLIPANVGSTNAYARVMENGKQKFVKVKPTENGIAIYKGKEVLAFDNVEGIDVTSKYFLDETDNPNIGNILIGLSDKQIKLAMADPFVDYIIPFHTGQKKSVLHAKGILTWENYKDVQLDKKQAGSNSKNKEINIYTDVLAKYNPQNAKEFQEAFLKECKAQKFTPRFEEFSKEDGYYKVLLDFKLFDKNGNIVPQGNVVPDIDEKLALKILKEGKKREEQTRFSDEVMSKVKDELQLNSSKVDSEGNNLTDDQVKFFEKSKVRNAEGNLVPVYHGSKQYGFTVFDPKFSDDKLSLFFTDSREMAQSYVNDDSKEYKVYLNITNPLEIDARGANWNRIYLEEDLNQLEPLVSSSLRFVDLAKKFDASIDYSLLSESIGNIVSSLDYIKHEIEENGDAVSDFWTEEDWAELEKIANELDEEYANWNADEHLDEDGYPMEMDEYLRARAFEIKSYNTRQLAKYASQNGYDGVIIKNVQDNGKYATERGKLSEANVYIAFNSNQVKLTSNEHPTENEDIRYSDKIEKTLNENLLVDRNEIINFAEEVSSKGKTDYPFNTIKISKIPSALAELIEKATGVNGIKNKVFGLEAGKLHHEFRSHNNPNVENASKQMAYTKKEIMDIVVTMIDPDFIENVSVGDKLDERHTFVEARKIDGVYVVVEAIGGRYNPTIVPVQILRFTDEKWNEFIESGKALKEIIYANTEKRLRDSDANVEEIIKNRVIVERTEPQSSISHTSETGPHSPLFDSTIPNGNESVNTFKSEKVDTGYHAGDLGKAEYRSSQSIDRGTGHFGTGTYFVGNEEQINRGGYGNRPHRGVDFSKYNLFKPKNSKDGVRLHDALWRLDSGLPQNWYEALAKDQFKLIPSVYDVAESIDADNRYSDETLEKAYRQLAETYDIDITEAEDYEDIKDIVKDGIESIENRYGKIRDAVFDFQMLFGFDTPKIMKALKAVSNAYENNDDSIKNQDSYATVFMKAMGYDGVDVRGTSLDNTTYGSVIYDLSDDSILFSQKVDTETPDILGINKKLERENAQLKAAYDQLKEKYKLQGKQTFGKVLNDDDIRNVASAILREANSSYKKNDLFNELKEAYHQFHNSETSFEEVMDRFSQIASNVLSEARVENTGDTYAQHILRDLRGTRVHLTERQIAELKNIYGDTYRNMFMGKIILTKDQGMSFEELFNHYSDTLGWEANIAAENMPEAFLNHYYNLYQTANVYENAATTEAINNLAENIVNRYYGIGTVKTLTDKYTEQMMRDKKKYKEALAKVRDDRDEKISKLREAVRDRKQGERDQRERNRLISKISGNADKLRKLLLENSAKHHIIDDLKAPVATLLDAIDFSSKRYLSGGESTQKDKSIARAMEAIDNMVKDIQAKQNDGMYVDIPQDMVDDIELIMESIRVLEDEVGPEIRVDNQLALRNLDVNALASLDRMVEMMRHIVVNSNKLMASRNAHSVDNVAVKLIKTAREVGKRAFEDNALTKFFTSKQATPYYFFKHLGDGGTEIFTELQDGWDAFAFRVNDIKKAFRDVLKDSGVVNKKGEADTSELNKWRNEIHTIQLREAATVDEVANGEDGKLVDVKMTSTQIMSLYCLSKREQAMGHILKDGITIDNIKEKNKTTSQQRLTITEDALNQIISELTDQQKSVADGLQKFMSTTCAEWGNEITMKRFGIRAFTEENYFPINVDSDVIGKEAKEQQESSIFRLLNLSFTKKLTQNAANKIMIGDIFSTFVAHTSDMAKYNTLALPILDVFKVLNYKEVTLTEGSQREVENTRQVLKDAYGSKCLEYINKLLVDLNGSQTVKQEVTLTKTLIRNYKAAAVGANLQVALLQPLSYIRAGYVMNPKYLAKALSNPVRVARDINVPKENCGISAWKDFGNFDTNISRGLEHNILGDDGIKDQIITRSMDGAQLMDDVTWSAIYIACEYEIKDKHPGVSGDEFKKLVADRFREVIYGTQVVDSTMTRSQLMRSKNPFDQIATAFMSEPTVAYNMVMDGFAEMSNEYRKTHNLGQALSKYGDKVVKAAGCYVAGAVIESALRGVISALRNPIDDDDDEDTILARIIEQFKSEINPLGKIPVIKDIIDSLEGNKIGRSEYDFATRLYYAYNGFIKKGFTYKNFYSLMQGISEASGVPISGAMKDIVALWNATIGRMWDSLYIE